MVEEKQKETRVAPAARYVHARRVALTLWASTLWLGAIACQVPATGTNDQEEDEPTLSQDKPSGGGESGQSESPEKSPNEPSDNSETGATPDPEDEEKSEDSGPGEQSPDNSEATSSEGVETQGDSQTSSDGSNTDDGTGSDSSGTQEPDDSGDGKPTRDCAKIRWGSSNIIRVGDILQRGDTPGYVDSNGDNKPEEVRRTAGMCELHMTGRKCGLVLYGAD